MPLIVVHDVGWPHARRDTYYAPERIPAAHRQPLVENASLDPTEPGVADAGIPFRWAAEREGGPANGVLTAIEDFLADHGEHAYATVPLFWGIGVIWPADAPYAASLETTLRPWADNPTLARVESHRVAHLVGLCRTLSELSDLRGVSAEQELIIGAQTELLRRMLVSSAFGLAARLSSLRQGGKPLFSRAQVEAVLAIGNGHVAPQPPPGTGQVSSESDDASAAGPGSEPAASAAS
jgi:hypothetical protein